MPRGAVADSEHRAGRDVRFEIGHGAKWRRGEVLAKRPTISLGMARMKINSGATHMGCQVASGAAEKFSLLGCGQFDALSCLKVVSKPEIPARRASEWIKLGSSRTLNPLARAACSY
jgi:hypothetical protein